MRMTQIIACAVVSVFTSLLSVQAEAQPGDSYFVFVYERLSAEPIESASVTIVAETGETKSAFTDKEGTVEFIEIVEGGTTYTVSVTADGYLGEEHTFKAQHLGPNSIRGGIEFWLKKKEE